MQDLKDLRNLTKWQWAWEVIKFFGLTGIVFIAIFYGLGLIAK